MTSNNNEIQGLQFRCTFSILLKPSDVQPRFSSPQLDIQCSTWKKIYIQDLTSESQQFQRKIKAVLLGRVM